MINTLHFLVAYSQGVCGASSTWELITEVNIIRNVKAAYCHPTYLTYMQSTSCKMPGWMKHKLESRMLEKYDKPQICRWHHTAESEEELKRLLMKVKEDTEKAGLELNIQKTKIMASIPITSWQIDGETMETVRDCILGDSKNHCRWWLQLWN